MKIRHLIILAASILLFPATLWAQTVVLVHGFQGNGMDWRKQGVTPVLQQYDWVDGGNVVMTQQGAYNFSTPAAKPERIFYTVELPLRAPIMLQTYWLNTYLQHIHTQRQEPLTLVGHSAGGIVSRAWLVSANSVPVDALVTIATPHVGTPSADLASMATDTPMGFFAEMMGFGKWSGDADDLYDDLRVEQPGRFLYWLNHQPHPPIRYVSVVRDNQIRPDRFDFVVPTYSQDMNNTFALRGKSEYWTVPRSHFLSIRDGYVLARILTH